MLRLLADEHISPAVARAARAACRGIHVTCLRDWHEGHMLGASDELVLEEAHREALTLVTYDLRTIPSLLRSWAEQGRVHGGVVLIDARSIPQRDVGGLAAALCALWKAERRADWTDRVLYLGRRSR